MVLRSAEVEAETRVTSDECSLTRGRAAERRA